MKHRLFTISVLVVIVLSTRSLAPVATGQLQGTALVQISWRSQTDLATVEASGIPVYARLAADRGTYLLAGATPQQIEALQAAGLDVTVLDPDLRGATYYLAYLMPGGARPDWEAYGRPLLDDGVQVLLRATPQDAKRLAEAGVQLQAVTFDPKPLGPAPARGSIPTAVDPDPLIQSMIDQVDMTTVYSYTGDLSGEWPVEIGGQPYTIVTRHTYSGVPIQKATQFVGEHLADLGLAVEYHQWGGATYPNVIGELPGLVNPDEIFIIGAHVDDMPSGPLAPGADDNGSGAVATLLAADIATQYQWGCTLRFALWTGEEQGLNGSHAYAQRSYNMGENILGYLNLDMIAWNSVGSNPDIDLHADSDLSETLVLAQLFADVVDAYDLNLIPQIVPNGTGASDHASFWQYGYTAILGIEDFGDFNPHYHTVNDDMDNFQDWPYYVDFVKASIATFAHMSGCLIPTEMGALDGHVTAASSGDPIVEATVSIDDGSGHAFAPTTDPSGYYTQTLPAGTYDVTASKTGYFSETVAAVDVQADMVTTQDFALQPIQAIVVEPQALEATLHPGDATTQTLWVTNTGESDLTFAVHELSRTLTVAAGPLVQPRAEPLVDPEVRNQVQAEGQAEVIIHLREQADLSPAYTIRDWAERGRFVYDRLRETAERSGGALRTLLEDAGAQPQVLLAANAIAATVDAPLLDAVAARPEVARVSPNREGLALPFLPAEQGANIAAAEWNIAQIRADEAWDTFGVTGQGVTVGNIGTGVMYNHPALVEQYRGNLGGGSFDHDYNWYDLIGSLAEPYDDGGHSTMTTGVMIGDDGGSNQIGVAPGAQWITVKAITGGGSTTDALLHQAMDWMLAPTDLNGANPDPSKRPDIGLNAWQQPAVTCSPEFEMDIAAWWAAGILPVFGLAGDGPACYSIWSPSDLLGAISAGATDAADMISSFSPRGPSLCTTEIKPEVAAPGVNIRSSSNDGAYQTWSGTSLSAPHLAGTAALVLSADPDLGPLQAFSAITNTAFCIEDLSCGGTPCPDGANYVYGWGRIDAFEAVSLTLGGVSYDIPWLSVDPAGATLGPGEGISLSVDFDAAGLEPGTYLGLLDVESDDPVAPHVSVPATLTVELEPSCDPVDVVTVTTGISGCAVAFGADLAGTEPFTYAWDFGAFGLPTVPTPTIDFGASGTYPFTLTVSNCSAAYSDTMTGTVAVECAAPTWYIYLPLVQRGG
jgi:subtilisin family serine protease